MRRTLVVLLAACGGHAAPPPQSPQPPAAATAFAATRWAPAKPTYLLAAKSMRDFQGTLLGMLDGMGHAREAESELTQVLGIDALSADATGAAGVDPDGGIVMFSEDLAPTFVLHLSAPDATQAWFQQQRERGLHTRSQVVDGVEVFTTKLVPDVDASWAIDHDWMWVHFETSGAADTSWFEHSHHPTAQSWAVDWGFAEKLGDKLKSKAAKVLGFIDPRALFDKISKRVGAAVACAKVVQPIEHAAFAFDGDLDHLDLRMSLDVGAHAADVQRAVLPPPTGWPATFAGAPVDVELNLDLDTFASWAQPCFDVADIHVKDAKRHGVRAVRVGVLAVDPDATWGTGAISADLQTSTEVGKLLDEIPMRKHLESDRAFGTLHGHRIKIPFKGTIDYVLDDHVALLGVSEGLLDKLVVGAPSTPPAAISIDLRPAAMPAETWKWLFEQLDVKPRLADLLLGWRALHLGLTTDHDSLVFELSGNRK